MAGIGLHKGRPSIVNFLPADVATGIRFFMPDLTLPIKASLENVVSTLRGTNLSDGTRVIYTVEHIMSACAGNVGKPVEGPPRCTSTITHGVSVMAA